MATAASELTPRQAEVERFVREYQDVHSYAPSVRDVASWLGVSPSGALCHLRAVEAKGRITHDVGVARSWRTLNKCQP